jgi:beta-lactamase regulating signal transducer with metallopeptidase domain/protocatechuate 3,4-dioxygenase beta subunit
LASFGAADWVRLVDTINSGEGSIHHGGGNLGAHNERHRLRIYNIFWTRAVDDRESVLTERNVAMPHDLATPLMLGAGLALTWLVQSTALLVVGLLAGRLVRRSGPAVQSAVYRTTLTAVLVCPIASVLSTAMGFDGLNLRLPPPRVEVFGMKALHADFKMVPVPPPMDVDEVKSRRDFQPLDRTTAAVAPAPAQPAEMRREPTFSARPVRAYRPSSLVPIAGAALAVWLIGSFGLGMRLLIGQRRMSQLRATAVPVEPDVEALCGEIAAQLRLTTPRVLRSPFLFSPCLDGFLRPAILLPDDAAGNLRDTFVHELAHLARRDGLWNLLRRSAVAVLWVQPLLWVLSRRLEATAEEVCDDYVVQHGGDRAGYAGHLVELAGRALPPTAITGVGMISLRSLLARRVVRILDSSRSLSTCAGRRAVAASLLMGLAGTLLAGMLGVGGIKKEAKAEAPPKTAEAKPEVKQTDDGRTVRGQVIDPDGKPVPGATVTVARFRRAGIGNYVFDGERQEMGRVGTDSEGRFVLQFEDIDEASSEDPRAPEHWRRIAIVATSPGFGPASIDARQSSIDVPLKLTLVRDDVPITGRLLDLEGRPIGGVDIKVYKVFESSGPHAIDDWLALLAGGRPGNAPPEARYFPLGGHSLPETDPSLPRPVRSDADGHFRIDGLGRDRLAILELSGPSTAFKRVEVVTRRMKRVQGRPLDEAGIRDNDYHGADCTIVVEPGRTIEGMVLDRESKAPIPGAIVTPSSFAGFPTSIAGLIQSVTDKEGRYRLIGAPKGGEHKLDVYPPLDLPYFLTENLAVPDSPGLGPLHLDIGLKRGTWITGRVTDARSGKPVQVAIHYYPFLSNELAKEFPNFRPNLVSYNWTGDRYRTDREGRFRVVGISGRGVLAAKSYDRTYRIGVGADKLEEKPGRQSVVRADALPTYNQLQPRRFHAIASINPAAGATEFHRDLILEPAPSLSVRLVDPTGEALTGVRACGLFPNEFSFGPPSRDTRLRISGLEPEKSRGVLFRHPGRNLGALLEIPPEKSKGGDELTVTLRPNATVIGRLVDEDGKPAAGGVAVRMSHAGFTFAQSINIGAAQLDAEGRFRCDELTAGGKYHVRATNRLVQSAMMKGAAAFKDFEVARDLTVEPGQTVDVGTFNVNTGKRVDEPAKAAESETKKPDDDRLVRGQVVDEDGKPVPGATVIATQRHLTMDGIGQPVRRGPIRHETVRTTADRDGRFEIGFDSPRPEGTVGPTVGVRGPHFEVTAMAPGYGLGYYLKGQPIRLRRGDTPINGRVVDLEGRPVAGAKVRLISAQIPDRAMEGGSIGVDAEPALPDGITTDADGRFQIQGLGRNVMAHLELSGPTIVFRTFWIFTGELGETASRRSPSAYRDLRDLQAYGADCTIVSAPTRPIEGIVKDLETGEPIPDAFVTGFQLSGSTASIEGYVSATTDARGHYRLVGLPKEDGKGHRLKVFPPLDRPYFITDKLQAPSSPGLDPNQFDIPLRRAMWIEGKVTDLKTGKPVQAGIGYYPLLSNPHARDYSNFDPNISRTLPVDSRYRTDREGRYRVVGLPGQGVVTVRADDKGYRAGVGADAIEQTKRGSLLTYDQLSPNWYHVLKEVGLPEDAKTFACDLALDPGGSVTVKLVDEAGKPVSGATFEGRYPQFIEMNGDHNLYDETMARVGGIDPNETRTVVFRHKVRKIGAVLDVTPEMAKAGGEIALTLRPNATITGRFVGDIGSPPPGGVQVRIIKPQPGFPEPREIRIADAQLGADGRFRCDEIPPGAKCLIRGTGRLVFGLPNAMDRPFKDFEVARDFVAEPGRTVDLGTFDVNTGKKVAASTAAAEAKPIPDVKPANVPITGRVIDLEGRPIPGVAIEALERSPVGPGAVDPWIEAARRGDPDWKLRQIVSHLRLANRGTLRQWSVPPKILTDSQGRFEYKLGGGDWILGLKISGPGLALSEVMVINRKMEPFVAPGLRSKLGAGGTTVYGADCSIVAAPGRAVVGTVRDARTGEPVAGVAVESDCFAGSWLRGNVRDLKAVTDAQGRFRLDGFPKGLGSKIGVSPRLDQPYFVRQLDVPDPAGLDPIEMAVELHRGLWITGKVTNKKTGEPVEGARLQYLPFLDNEFPRELPEFGNGFVRGDWSQRYQTAEDGTFRLLGLPGHAIIGTDHGGLAFRKGMGSESIAGMGADGNFKTWHNPMNASKNWPDSMKEINPAKVEDEVRVDLELDPGGTVRLTAVDPEGRPAGDLSVMRVSNSGARSQANQSPDVEAINFAPNEARTVVLREERRGIGKAVRVRLGDDAKGPVVVKLEPLAAITGRVVDADDQPIVGATVNASMKPVEDYHPSLPDVVTDRAGRFRVPGVPVGCDYRLSVHRNRTNARSFNTTWGDATVKPGETTDVGDVKFKKN